jgi:biopolymer transport protein ExbD
MARFKNKKSKGLPPISTASLPDIVFMLLFFFMVTTVMREVVLKVEVTTPYATEIQKLEKKNLVSYIYIGPPLKQIQSKLGSEARIQLNDQFSEPNEIAEFVELERKKRNEVDRPKIIFSLKVDQKAKMGIVTDVKQELRKADALKISYSARQAKTASAN